MNDVKYLAGRRADVRATQNRTVQPLADAELIAAKLDEANPAVAAAGVIEWLIKADLDYTLIGELNKATNAKMWEVFKNEQRIED